MGPLQYVQHLVSGPRLPFTAAYFGSIALTIYFAVGVSSIYYIVLTYLSQPSFEWQAFLLLQNTPVITAGASWSCPLTVNHEPQFVDESHASVLKEFPLPPKTSRQGLTRLCCTAPLYTSNPLIVNRAACGFDLVLGELLSHGRHRTAIRCSFRW